ncbi:MAG: hypothetical protein GOVbin630_92 [Prokaryotic dsDNA virus sp.]|nr:MAG: hypothetical protein GOVbin630_92 [Prokaryotic dsDNA virus sp.]|tara:strand:+ start:5488 stop:5736 length:249 start_codon:yes stop_codon:yes gene_type:complete
MSEAQHTKLSQQAVGALMMALQKSLLEQSDIVPVLENFKLVSSAEGLVVLNPPVVKFNEETTAGHDWDVVGTQPTSTKQSVD